jgi:hypothetical protein
VKKVKKTLKILAIAAVIFAIGMPIVIVYETVLFFTLLFDRLLETWTND